MKCEYCNTVNPDDAKICRMCGKDLKPQTIIERYHQYQFLPTTLAKLKGSLWARFFLIIWTLFFLFILINIIYLIVEEQHLKEPAVFITIMVFLLIILTACKLLVKSFPNKFRRKRLIKQADYIQTYKSCKEKFVFYVKDNKFGLYDVKRFKVQLPANYDSLSWNIDNQILNVDQNGRQYTIDIYGNELK